MSNKNAIDENEFLAQAKRERERLEDETRLRLGECRGTELLAQALLIMARKRDQERVVHPLDF